MEQKEKYSILINNDADGAWNIKYNFDDNKHTGEVVGTGSTIEDAAQDILNKVEQLYKTPTEEESFIGDCSKDELIDMVINQSKYIDELEDELDEMSISVNKLTTTVDELLEQNAELCDIIDNLEDTIDNYNINKQQQKPVDDYKLSLNDVASFTTKINDIYNDIIKDLLK